MALEQHFLKSHRFMDEYIREMQKRLQEKKIGDKKEFLREILKEARVRGNEVKLTYRLPMTLRTPPAAGKRLGQGSSLQCINWWS